MTQTVSDIVNARRIIDGPSDLFRAVSANRYPWVNPLWKRMLANNWVPEQVPMKRDKMQFGEMSEGSQFGFRSALAFLSNLDAIQVDNLTANISGVITDPSIRELISRQTYEEAIHNKSYSTIVEDLFPNETLDIYDMARSVELLRNKNTMIMAQANEVTVTPTPANKVRAFVSNIILEGVYFFSGFLTFYSIARSTGKMLETRDMIRYIQRDELTHLDIFANIYLSCKAERPEVFTKELAEECQELFRAAAEHEIAWGHYSIQKGVPGLSEEGVTLFIQDRAEKCARMIGLGGVFPKARQPYAWFDDYSSLENMNKVQKNFFEGRNGRYSESIPQFSHSRKREIAV